MIVFNNVTKKFGKFTALSNINLSFDPGECIALIGPNACGKTTLIKSILGLVLPTAGTISFNGKNILGERLYRANIGYMPQIGRYPDSMTVGQIFDMVLKIREIKNLPDAGLIETYGIKGMYHKKMSSLSGGTIQKVSASLAFLFDPTVLILDEPTAGLDPLASEILKEKIAKEKEKGKLILITSHLLSELDGLVSELVFMQEGSIVFHKKIDALMEETGQSKISKAISSILKKSNPKKANVF